MLRCALGSLWLHWVWLILTHRKGLKEHDNSVVVAHSCTFSLWLCAVIKCLESYYEICPMAYLMVDVSPYSSGNGV